MFNILSKIRIGTLAYFYREGEDSESFYDNDTNQLFLC
jgi:hypothetical protein